MSMADEARKAQFEMNMTPMIDVVFQLIIFFMLVTDMTTRQLEEMKLPSAQNARPDKDPPVERLVLNITYKDMKAKKPDKWEYKIAGAIIRPNELLERLRRHARQKMDHTTNASEMPVLIRCDENIYYRAVLKVLVECMNARIWKIQLAIRDPNPQGSR